MMAGTSRRSVRSRDEGLAGAPLQREPHAGAGDDEQQRHAQPMRDVHGQLQRRDGLGVRDVPAPADEQHAGVEEQQHEDRDDAQPVEEFVARGLRGHGRGSSWRMSSA